MRSIRSVLIPLAVGAAVLAPATTAGAAPRVLWTGTFVGVGEHNVSGTARVVKLANGGRRLVLRSFSTDNGPDLRVWLTKGVIDESSDVTAYRGLGRLKRTAGSQSYVIPRGVRIASLRTAIIWCEDFSVLFGAARLSRP